MKRLAVALLLCSCNAAGPDDSDSRDPAGGKADEFADARVWEVITTDPHCDVCTSADKEHLLRESKIIARVLELIAGAQTSIDVAQFTFSNRDIEAALLQASKDGKRVRVAIDSAQKNGDTVATRLAAAGVDVVFVAGKGTGLQHAKYMLVDETKLLMGSNNWSSTGTSINEENTIVLESAEGDPMIAAFGCYFDAMFENRIDDGPACSTEEVFFTPSSRPSTIVRDEIRAAERSVDVLMHHLVFDKSIKELTAAAKRDGVRVRVIVNAADRGEIKGSLWDAFFAAGGEVRFKQTNAELFQIMHHKLVVIDGDTLVVGSGNWSGSAFFNNWEFYVRSRDAAVVEPFGATFERLWQWSLTADALDRGLTAAQQDAEGHELFFGNLHAHFDAHEGERILDDGKNEREIEGERRGVTDEFDHGDSARFAFEYSRDEGGLDFLAVTPHVVDDRVDEPADVPNMTTAGFAQLRDTAAKVTEESEGTFLAIAGMEWSTNSTGNHVNVLGTSELCKVERGAFDELYAEFLPAREQLGEHPIVMLNHPRTFKQHDDPAELGGTWDQVFGVSLADIPKAGERRLKFNDFGLDDFEPLRSVRERWIAGEVQPDEATVAETLAAVRDASAPYSRLIEVTVSRGTEFAGDEPRNPSLTEDEMGVVERVTQIEDWHYYLRHGFRLAPAASHDNHLANWGTAHTSRTVIAAPKLDEASLLEAIAQRNVYASEDQNLELRVYAEGRVRAGDELRTIEDTITLDVQLSDPDFVDRFAVTIFLGTVGGGAVQAVSEHELAAEEWHRLDVALPGEGEHFVYVQVHEAEPDRMAWSAPVFIRR